MLADYQPADTLPHRLDPRPKLLAFAVGVVAFFLFAHPLANLVLVVIAFGLCAWAKVSHRRLLPVVVPLLPLLVLIPVLSAVSYGPARFDGSAARVLFHLVPGTDHLPFTVGGLLTGCTLALRLLGMVALTTALTVSTPIDGIVQLMRKARLPYPLTFLVVTALRFVPTMHRRAEQVQDAQRARGARLERGGMLGRVRAFVPVMVPLLAESLRMADNLAAAMLNRGYGASRKVASLYEIRMRARDWVAVAALTVVLGAVVALRIRWGSWGF
ncbi:energy-coupling factor transporter transmembrane component T family protein [Actinopolymorpha alba]|uniref:energy-coupling factor transporter transmembrane component T family protein n=1 Tax=Actinopolymorpha alba TaxID=533267 RepID=UPI0003816F74|nr:energy-coupling factor transporter transmembrane component T [Actinopolymorpha alba]